MSPNAAHPIHDCIIVGAGPAGLVAATYLQRFRRDIVVIDAGSSRARYIPVSHNCPGYPHGIKGTELLAKLRQQALDHRVPIIDGRVLRIEPDQTLFHALTEDGRMWTAHTVIVATGVVDRLPSWPGVEEAIATGVVRLCAICDGYEVMGKRIAVYGDAVSGVGHACFLRTYGVHVTLVLPPGSRPAREQVEQAAQTGIELLYAGEGDCVLGQSSFVVSVADATPRVFDVVYICLGAASQSALVQGLVTVNGRERDLDVDASCETSMHGIFAIGDAVSALNQISVAFGHAAIAASAVHQRLARNPLVASDVDAVAA